MASQPAPALPQRPGCITAYVILLVLSAVLVALGGILVGLGFIGDTAMQQELNAEGAHCWAACWSSVQG